MDPWTTLRCRSSDAKTTPAPGGPDDPAVREHRLKLVVSKQDGRRRPASGDDDDDDDNYDVFGDEPTFL